MDKVKCEAALFHTPEEYTTLGCGVQMLQDAEEYAL